MTGFELLAFFGTCFILGAGAVTTAVHLHERRKRRFLRHVVRTLGAGTTLVDVESGDVEHPLAFTLGSTRVRAVVRGRTELWQLERIGADMRAFAAGIDAAPDALAVVQRGWHAPDVRSLVEVADLTPRLRVYADHADGALRLLRRAHGDLCTVLGRRTRRCVVGSGRVFIEVARRGLTIDELDDGLRRLDALVAVLLGQPPCLPAGRAASRCTVTGPGGALIPGLTDDDAR